MWPSDCWVTAYVALEQKSLETPGLRWCNDRLESTFKKQSNTKALELRKRNLEVATKFVYNETWAGLRRCWEMTDLLHNRELVVWWLSVMTSFYAAMKCCIVGSCKSGSTSTCLSMWSIARFETKAFWSVARWWMILFLDVVPLKSESVSS